MLAPTETYRPSSDFLSVRDFAVLPVPQEDEAEVPSLLIVDDDPTVLNWLVRRLESRYRVRTAQSAAQGLGIVGANPPAVVLSDQRMPGLTGIELLARVRSLAPETVRILFTGARDVDTAVESINSGEVFRFLTKPLRGEQLDRALEAAVEQHRLVTAQRVLLTKTLHGSIQVLVDLLAMTSPEIFGHATRVKELATLLGAALKCTPLWELEVAAMLSFIGLLAVPEETVRKALAMDPLPSAERSRYEQYPEQSAQLISHIPRLENVHRIIRFHQGDHPLEDTRVPLAARIIRAASDYHALLRRGLTHEAAIESIGRSAQHPPAVVATLEATVPGTEEERIHVPVEHLAPGMVIARDVWSSNGAILLLARGQRLTDLLIQRLKNLHRRQSVASLVTIAESAAGPAWT